MKFNKNQKIPCLPPDLCNLNQFSQITFLTTFDAMVLKLSALARQSNIIGQPPKRGTGFEGKRCRKIIFAALGGNKSNWGWEASPDRGQRPNKDFGKKQTKKDFRGWAEERKSKSDSKGAKNAFFVQKKIPNDILRTKKFFCKESLGGGDVVVE